MKAARPSEALVCCCQTTRRHIPQDSNLKLSNSLNNYEIRTEPTPLAKHKKN